MGAIGRGIGKAVGTVASVIGVTDVAKRAVKQAPLLKKPEVVMPDEEALKLAARKRGALRARRSGRVATILDNEDALGG